MPACSEGPQGPLCEMGKREERVLRHEHPTSICQPPKTLPSEQETLGNIASDKKIRVLVKYV